MGVIKWFLNKLISGGPHPVDIDIYTWKWDFPASHLEIPATWDKASWSGQTAAELRPEQEKLLARLAPHSNAWLAVWGHQSRAGFNSDGMGKVLFGLKQTQRYQVTVWMWHCTWKSRCFMCLIMFACVVCHVGWNLFYSKSARLWALQSFRYACDRCFSLCCNLKPWLNNRKDSATWLSPAFLVSMGSCIFILANWVDGEA